MVFPIPDSYTAGVDRMIYAGTALPLGNGAFVGDSNASESYGFLHPWTWTTGLNGGRLKPVANSSVAGDTIANVLARIHNHYTHASPGIAGLPPLAMVWNRYGTNNTRGGEQISAQNKADYEAIAEAELTYAEKAVFFPVFPIGAPESGAGVNSFNVWLAEFCATDSRLLFVDDCATVNNGSGGWASGYGSSDNVHLSNAASCQIGIDGGTNPALSALLAGYASPLITDPLDVYPAQPQWIVNPFVTGTGGSNGGLSGVVADDWAFGRSGSGLEATLSKFTDAEGVWQRITPTQITDNGVDGGFGIGATLAYAALTSLYPDAVDFAMQIRFNDFDISKFRYVRSNLNGNNNEELAPAAYLRMGAPGRLSGTCVLRSALRRSGTRQSHSSASGVLGLCPSTSFTGDMGLIDFQRVTIRG